jgi:glycerate kinase
MRVLIAFDKFKDSLTAPEACAAAARPLAQAYPDWALDLCPLADGGEGFASLLTHAAGGDWKAVRVTGPLGERREAAFGRVALGSIPRAARARLGVAEMSPDADSTARTPRRNVAVIEMASASGLALVPPSERDPWRATSRGTGELIRAAADAGVAAILLGVGGSATNDLGLGALGALGFDFWTAAGDRCELPVPARWEELARIGGRTPALPPIRIACDVANPLFGPGGAAAVYGPQKGLLAGDLGRLERLSARMAGLLAEQCGQPLSLAAVPGAGAAGGIAFGLMVAARAKLLPGFELIADWLDLGARMAAADLVLTGEGRFDSSSSQGKGPGALVARARALGKPVHVFAGQVTSTARGAKLHAITPAGMPLDEALRSAESLLAAAVSAAF